MKKYIHTALLTGGMLGFFATSLFCSTQTLIDRLITEAKKGNQIAYMIGMMHPTTIEQVSSQKQATNWFCQNSYLFGIQKALHQYPKDLATTYDLCVAGDAEGSWFASLKLGQLYLYGWGVAPDSKRAKELFKKVNDAPAVIFKYICSALGQSGEALTLRQQENISLGLLGGAMQDGDIEALGQLAEYIDT